MPAYGVTAAGFVVKPISQILADMQAAAWASPQLGPQLDLSPQTPDGQMLGIIAAEAGSNWDLLQVVFNQFNREDAEGASLDNIGDLTGNPREGISSTIVACNLVIANGTYAPGSLVANVAGQTQQTFSNVGTLTVTGGMATGVTFASTTPGPTPAVNPSTLTQITTAVAGWTSITNPSAQSQIGSNAELDSPYAVRQEQEIFGEGSCNQGATAAALIKLGLAQSPPENLSVNIIVNPNNAPTVIGGISVPPHSYYVVIYDNGSGWATGAGLNLIAQTIYDNRPAGIQSLGSTNVTVVDPILGSQTVAFTVPSPLRLYVHVTAVEVQSSSAPPFSGPSSLTIAIQNALAAASLAPTQSNGAPPPGQLIPGGTVVGSQLEGVVMGVPWVYDVQALAFAFAPSPVNTNPIPVNAFSVATLAAGDVTVTQGTFP